MDGTWLRHKPGNGTLPEKRHWRTLPFHPKCDKRNFWALRLHSRAPDHHFENICWCDCDLWVDLHHIIYILCPHQLNACVRSCCGAACCCLCLFSGFSKILNGSGCVVEASLLTCVCVSQGVPLPSIRWPVLENHTNYHIITTVTNYTVNSTVFLTVNDVGRTAVQCVSSHGDGDEKENLSIQLQTSKPGELSHLITFHSINQIRNVMCLQQMS